MKEGIVTKIAFRLIQCGAESAKRGQSLTYRPAPREGMPSIIELGEQNRAEREMGNVVGLQE